MESFDLTLCLCLSVSLDKAPHFSRLGDEEVNAGQNATFQCVAAGRAAEAEKFLLEVSGLMVAKGTCVSESDMWELVKKYFFTSKAVNTTERKTGFGVLHTWLTECFIV